MLTVNQIQAQDLTTNNIMVDGTNNKPAYITSLNLIYSLPSPQMDTEYIPSTRFMIDKVDNMVDQSASDFVDEILVTNIT